MVRLDGDRHRRVEGVDGFYSPPLSELVLCSDH